MTSGIHVYTSAPCDKTAKKIKPAASPTILATTNDERDTGFDNTQAAVWLRRSSISAFCETPIAASVQRTGERP